MSSTPTTATTTTGTTTTAATTTATTTIATTTAATTTTATTTAATTTTTTAAASEFYIKPVSPVSFLLIAIDPATNVVVPSATSEPHDNYKGLYKLLVNLHKLDLASFGSIHMNLLSLPRPVTLENTNVPNGFEAQYPLSTLRKELLAFMELWFNMSIESQNVNTVNPAVNHKPWPNMNTVKPQPPASIQKSNDGVYVTSTANQRQQDQTILGLVAEIQALEAAITNCQANNAECPKAITLAQNANNTAKKLQTMLRA